MIMTANRRPPSGTIKRLERYSFAGHKLPRTARMTESLPSTLDNRIGEFSTRFTKQAGAIYPAASPDELVSILNSLVKSRGKGESCCSPNLVISFNGKQLNVSDRIASSVAYTELQKNPRKLVGQIDVGVTRADYAIAETGCIVDISYTDEHRLLSALTRVHVAILEKSCILPKLSNLSTTMHDLLGPASREKPSITFIGGPSRTSDIELKSVLGVHGPHEVHVVLI
jgi:L-lactate utilization protein LutC